jgi:preprotein translocase subunit SecD
VLIFERIREELANGRSVIAAIDSGYQRALATIIDSNLTTLFAALFLYIFGSGPIKGFAVTLGIGIATSLFSAVMVTRMFIALWVARKRPKTLAL